MSYTLNSKAPPLPTRPPTIRPSFSYCLPALEAPPLEEPFNRKKMSLDSCTPVRRLQIRSPSLVTGSFFEPDDDDIYVSENAKEKTAYVRDIEKEGGVYGKASQTQPVLPPIKQKLLNNANKEINLDIKLDVQIIPNKVECETIQSIICTIKNDKIAIGNSKITKIQIMNSKNKSLESINYFNKNTIENKEYDENNDYLTKNERDECSEISVNYINHQTVQFTTPYCNHPKEIDLRITVLIDDSSRAVFSKKLSYVRTKNEELADDLSHIYIQMVADLLQLALVNNIDQKKIDNILSSVFQDDFAEETSRFSILAFENMFRVGKFREKTDVLYPSLLHLSSRFNLHKLTTILVDLPDSDAALSRLNSRGQKPIQLCADPQLSLMLEHGRNGNDGEVDRLSDDVNEYLPMDPSLRYTCPNIQSILLRPPLKSNRPPLPCTPDSSATYSTPLYITQNVSSGRISPSSKASEPSKRNIHFQKLSLGNGTNGLKGLSSSSNDIISNCKTPDPAWSSLPVDSANDFNYKTLGPQIANSGNKVCMSVSSDSQMTKSATGTPLPMVAAMSDDEMFKKGATCKSQLELLNIIEQVKRNNISVKEANSLFNQWKLKDSCDIRINGGEISDNDAGNSARLNSGVSGKFKQNAYSQRSIDRKKSKMPKQISNWLYNGRSHSVADGKLTSSSTTSINKSTIDLSIPATITPSESAETDEDMPKCPPVPPRPPFLSQLDKIKNIY